ncbi:MAG TPA: YdiU family protein [Castellaniella sp.]|uniref:protein adenylyltransferase SelO n=1 Tax=Castellaniella sp. TaxID=1955812 RepID=UPI002EE4C296
MDELFSQARLRCSFATLPATFYSCVEPRPLTAPRLLHVDAELASMLGLTESDCHSAAFLALCAGGRRLAADIAPIATVYSGHQFGVWAGQLGDGRAHLLGDITLGETTWELQLKGSGRTPYSRMGDGWAVLRSSVREYLASEAMNGLGIPTTRALALVASDDRVVRESLETAAIVARLAPSFIRFGHFEHWASSHHDQAALLCYVVQRFYPHCWVGSAESPDVAQMALNLLSEVVQRTARLLARWQLVGFCHGVMNTDNMSILGLTLDYGPYGFMDGFQIDHVCNHSDTSGRYAWNAQPGVARWNLYRLAESFQVLGCDVPSLDACLQSFESLFLQAYREGLARKWGLSAWRSEDLALENDWWALLHSQHADFTLAFRHLAQVSSDATPWLSLFADPAPAQAWLDRYVARLAQEDPGTWPVRRTQMDASNPLYVLRNHLAQEAIVAVQQGDVSRLDRLFTVLRRPYEFHPGCEDLARPPRDDLPQVAVSCSS